MKLLVATTSEYKVKEIRSILSDSGLDLISLSQIAPVAAPLETGSTFEENARLKATCYREATGYASLADDSGLEVDALGGSPGVFSSRFAPTEEQRIAGFSTGSGTSPAPETSPYERRDSCAQSVWTGEGVSPGQQGL